MKEPSLFIEQQGDEWVVFEWSKDHEITRGRFKTETEAAIRVAELKPPRANEPLAIEEISDKPQIISRPTPPKHLSTLFNIPEQAWLVLGGPNNHNLKVIARFENQRQAKRFIKTLKQHTPERKSWGP